MVSRRVLDLATHLARHQGRVGRELVLLSVPTAAQQTRALAAAQARPPTALTLPCALQGSRSGFSWELACTPGCGWPRSRRVSWLRRRRGSPGLSPPFCRTLTWPVAAQA